MKRAIFPGSFDPLTKGHLDIIERASGMFEELIVVILENSEKKTMFSMEQRMAFLHHATSHLGNVKVAKDQGLSVAFAKQHNASIIVRSVRSMKDYEYEANLADVNYYLDATIETVILFARKQFQMVSSSMIKELLHYDQDIRPFVNEEVFLALKKDSL